MQDRYDPAVIEPEAQRYWAEHKSFEVREEPGRPKYYCLCMFPYPSGRLHMGHVRNYTIGDVLARYMRMQGCNVLQPMGWDAFGLPAENAAMANGVPPAKWTRDNIAHMKRQMKPLGFGIDWSRELATCQPEYYRWNQWLFLRMLERGIAYRRTGIVNWDPEDQTVLANEQVIDGRGWRTGALVEKREIPMYYLRITDYAEDLLAALDELPSWPERVKLMQANWIGRSEGLELAFDVEGGLEPLRVYTTRPDTLYGVTYMAVAAGHPLAQRAAQHSADLREFIAECQRSSVTEAAIETMEKRGRPLGVHAIHPLTGERIPVWVANFVLMGYGTGAVMAVPAHDQRDWEFARRYGLRIHQVIEPTDGRLVELDAGPYLEHGRLINSGQFDGLYFDEAFDAIAKSFEATGRGQRRVNWRLRDWGISRQRYWGAPIPVLYCEKDGLVPEAEENLPVVLPRDVQLSGKGGSPLAEVASFVNARCPKCGGKARRETDTMDTFVESSWYFLRYCSPTYDRGMFERGAAEYWMPVDQYIGGIEHAVLHLLYARFYTKVLRDLGMVKVDEPFTALLSQGMVIKDGAKMSKSKGNVVDPDDLIRTLGADTARLFSLFAAPPEKDLDWNDHGVEGASRFLNRVWRFVIAHMGEALAPPQSPPSALRPTTEAGKAFRRTVHETIAKATQDIERDFHFNTAISAVMELVNALYAFEATSHDGMPAGERAALLREAVETTLLLLGPIAPHVSEELWSQLGHAESLFTRPWPAADPAALVRQEVTLVVQVDGKVRSRLNISVGTPEERIQRLALADERVQPWVRERAVERVVVVANRLVNIVTRA